MIEREPSPYKIVRKYQVVSEIKKPSIVQSIVVLLQTAKMAVFVNSPVQILNMEGLSISSKRIIQDFLTYHQETVRNGNRNTTDGHLWNDQINVKR